MLMSSLGWKLVCDYISSEIARVQADINSLDMSMTSEELWKLKVLRASLEKLMSLPKELIGEGEAAVNVTPSEDPYGVN